MLSLNFNISLIRNQFSPVFMDKQTESFFCRDGQIFHRTDIKMLTCIDHGVAGATELKVFT